MKRWLALGVMVLFVLPGCCLSTPAFLRGVDAQWEVIAPEYRGYVTADPALTDADKKTRLRTADLMDHLIQEEKARHE